MKFYNSTICFNDTDFDQNGIGIYKQLLDSNVQNKSIVIITLQIINNTQTEISKISFKKTRKNELNEYVDTDYLSIINIKQGTTILDHLMVIPYNEKLYVNSQISGIVISCSYGI